MGLMIDGVAASSALDTSGEIVDIRGMDITSLAVSGTINFEHKSDLPAQTVGKILKAKKILKSSDCSNDREKYFWAKCELPFVYIVAELFDDYTESAKHLAGIFKYDEDNRTKHEKNVLSFSVEGAKIPGAIDGMHIKRSIARKVTVTVQPANHTAIAEKMPGAKSDDDGFGTMFKSESGFEIEMLKSEEILALLNSDNYAEELNKAAINHPPQAIGTTKSGKTVNSHGLIHESAHFTSADHRDAAELHRSVGRSYQDTNIRSHHNQKADLHLQAANSAEKREQKAKSFKPPEKKAEVPKTEVPKNEAPKIEPQKTRIGPNIETSVLRPYAQVQDKKPLVQKSEMNKAISAGMPTAPGSNVQGAALQASEEQATKPKTFSNAHVAKHWHQTANEGEHYSRENKEHFEDMLSDHHDGKWEKKSVPISSLDGHHAGHDASERYIASYAKQRESGSEFPPIIAKPHPEKPGHFQTIDGQHRLIAAKKLGQTHIDTYVPTNASKPMNKAISAGMPTAPGSNVQGAALQASEEYNPDGTGRAKRLELMKARIAKKKAIKKLAADELDKSAKPGLWANIHAKQKRIEHGSKEHMRSKKSSKAPSKQDFIESESGVKKSEDSPASSIGTTRSGKHIMSHADHPAHAGFTMGDHEDAFRAHDNAATSAGGVASNHHLAQRDIHEKSAFPTNPGKFKDRKAYVEHTRRDKAVDVAGNKHDLDPSPKNHQALVGAMDHRDAHIAATPGLKEHLDQSKAHRTAKFGPLKKSEDSPASSIGTTRSGKHIMSHADHPAHADYSKADHNDAAAMHNHIGEQMDKEHSNGVLGGTESHSDPLIAARYNHHYAQETAHKSLGSKSRASTGLPKSFKAAKAGQSAAAKKDADTASRMKKSELLERAKEEFKVWSKREAFMAFMKESKPSMTKSEAIAYGQTVALKEAFAAEEALGKLAKVLTFGDGKPAAKISPENDATPKPLPKEFRDHKKPVKGVEHTEVVHVQPHYDGKSPDTVYTKAGHKLEGHPKGKFKAGDKVTAKSFIMGTHTLEHGHND